MDFSAGLPLDPDAVMPRTERIEAAMDNFARIASRFLRKSQKSWSDAEAWTGLDWPGWVPNDTVKQSYGADQPPLFAIGRATRDTLTYQIIWGWMALPAALVLLVGLLILLTILDTRRKNAPP